MLCVKPCLYCGNTPLQAGRKWSFHGFLTRDNMKQGLGDTHTPASCRVLVGFVADVARARSCLSSFCQGGESVHFHKVGNAQNTLPTSIASQSLRSWCLNFDFRIQCGHKSKLIPPLHVLQVSHCVAVASHLRTFPGAGVTMP